MNKLSKRLNSLVYFVEKEDSIVDVGCDHGYLSIFLKKNNLCKHIMASDINQNALQSAKENIKKSKLKIDTVLSDGLENIPLKGINALLISGMGTSTILHILEAKEKIKNIKKIILQSNNEHAKLRKSLNDLGYYLKEERVVLDKGKWYVSMLFVQSNKKNKEREILYGYLNNPEYNQVVLEQFKKIQKKIPFTSIKAKITAYRDYKKYKKALK